MHEKFICRVSSAVLALMVLWLLFNIPQPRPQPNGETPRDIQKKIEQL